MSSTQLQQHYIRITKQHARERFDAGLPIRLCPRKFMPGGGFALDMLINPKTNFRSFESAVRDFCGYNANSHETGYYPHYYITDDMEPEPFQMLIREKIRAAKRTTNRRDW